MKINFFCEEVDSPKFIKSKIREIIKVISIEENVAFSIINIIFCTDVYLLEINKQYLHHDYFTDIITFDYRNDKFVSSDIYISIDRIQDNSQSLNISFENELNRIIIHGILHLSGYEDNTKNKRHNMSLKEDYYLNKIL